MRHVLVALIAALGLAACAEVIRASPDDVTISMKFVGAGTATEVANEHCAQYGKAALRVTPEGPPYDHLIKFRCVSIAAREDAAASASDTSGAWTVHGVPAEVRDFAVRAAQARRMPVGAWLAEAIAAYGWTERGLMPPRSP